MLKKVILSRLSYQEKLVFQDQVPMYESQGLRKAGTFPFSPSIMASASQVTEPLGSQLWHIPFQIAIDLISTSAPWARHASKKLQSNPGPSSFGMRSLQTLTAGTRNVILGNGARLLGTPSRGHPTTIHKPEKKDLQSLQNDAGLSNALSHWALLVGQ
ncbi:hypothetical protein P7K49_006129 [Saguinus oedipus]|uniref:Uncharacterized protein n=1 Tax=Saguinus oedipus TaxID=9490 RepID=A0ABQ9W1I2_SAGOE|nr:hypothetical protein P7K49_006129 [Saguinus oedipus]